VPSASSHTLEKENAAACRQYGVKDHLDHGSDRISFGSTFDYDARNNYRGTVTRDEGIYTGGSHLRGLATQQPARDIYGGGGSVQTRRFGDENSTAGGSMRTSINPGFGNSYYWASSAPYQVNYEKYRDAPSSGVSSSTFYPYHRLY
jgi:hypothetical protein